MQLEINSLSVLTISVLIFLWNKDDITSESFHFSSFKKICSNSLVVTSIWKCLLRKTKFKILQLFLPSTLLITCLSWKSSLTLVLKLLLFQFLVHVHMVLLFIFFSLDGFESLMRSVLFRLCVRLSWICLVFVYG